MDSDSTAEQSRRLCTSPGLSGRVRYVILALATLKMTFVTSNTLALNFTVICMFRNGSRNATERTMMFSPQEQSWLFSATSIGAILGCLLVSALTSRFGLRFVATLYGMISAVATVLSPWAVNMGFVPIMLARTLQLSMIFTMPVAAAFCESDWGWPGVYYLQGGITFLLTIVFFVFYRNQARNNCLVNDDETQLIEAGKSTAQREKVPYKAIFSDLAVWSVVVCWFGGSFGFKVLFLYGPTYLHKVLGFSVNSTGLAAALPYVLSIVVKMFLGPISDKLKCVSERARIVVFATVSQGMLALAAVPLGNAAISQAFFTAVTVFSGFNILGAVKSAQLIARQHSHAVMAMTFFATNIVTLILPQCVALLAPDNLPSQWALLFYLIAGLMFGCTLFFDLTARAEPRPWTQPQSPHAAFDDDVSSTSD